MKSWKQKGLLGCLGMMTMEVDVSDDLKDLTMLLHRFSIEYQIHDEFTVLIPGQWCAAEFKFDKDEKFVELDISE